MTMITYGQKHVARWCGVRTQTVCTWLSERDDYPEPDAEVRTWGRIIRGWLPEREQEWRDYAARRAASPGAVLVAMRRDRQEKS